MSCGKECNRDARTFAAGVASFLLCAFVLLSSMFLAMEAVHDCENEDCPICELVLLCETTIHQMGDASLGMALGAVLIVISCRILSLDADFLRHLSLVNLRVRLNN